MSAAAARTKHAICLSALTAWACGGPPPRDDRDAATPVRDAGTRDAELDASIDSSAGPTDASSDAGPAQDAGSWHLELVRVMDTAPFADSSESVGDTESLTYCPMSDTLWIADDSRNAIHQFARTDGHFIRRVTAADLLGGFVGAGSCDNGTITPCSYTDEIETVACDLESGALHLVNTVNNPSLDPPVDKQAAFRLREDVSGAILYDAWHPLPPGIQNPFDTMVVIDGTVYGGGGRALVEYDFAGQSYPSVEVDGTPVPVWTSGHGAIVGLGFEPPYLWALTSMRRVVKVHWPTRTVIAVQEIDQIASVSLGRPKGLGVARGEVYTVDGDPPHMIFVLAEVGNSASP